MTSVTQRRKGRQKKPVFGKDPLDDLVKPPPKAVSKADLYRILREAAENTAAMTPKRKRQR